MEVASREKVGGRRLDGAFMRPIRGGNGAQPAGQTSERLMPICAHPSISYPG